MARPVALALLRRAQHVLFAALVAVGAVRSVAEGRHPVWCVVGAVLLAAWYGLGVVLARRSGDRTVAALWLVALTVGWVALSLLSADFVWVVFPLFLLFLQLLPLRVALVCVAGLTAVTVAAFAWHRGRVDVAAVLGPVIGAAVAVVITVVYRDLREQSLELAAARDRLAATERRAGVLAERERLAREIHDTVGQSLSGIIMLLRSGRPGAVETAVTAAKGALEDTRRLVRALTPAELDGASLPKALEGLVAEARDYGLAATLVVDGEPPRLPTPAAVALLRAAQSAVANVRQHAGASRVAVTLTVQPDAVSVDVADDGKGFDPADPSPAPTSGTGLGLAAMRDRLAEVGGRLIVESRPGAGTAVNATVPRQEEP